MSKKADRMTINGYEYIREDQAQQQINLEVKPTGQDHPYSIGCFLYVETPTKYYVGDLVAVTDNELVLENAAWVAFTGRFNEFMKGAPPAELEPCGPGLHIIGRGAVISARPMNRIELVVR